MTTAGKVVFKFWRRITERVIIGSQVVKNQLELLQTMTAGNDLVGALMSYSSLGLRSFITAQSADQRKANVPPG